MGPTSFLEKLDGVRQTGQSQWLARCPLHDDNRASLSIALGEDGRILPNCHANCETTDIVAKLGLKMADLMPSGNGHTPNGKSKIVATYDYRDETGALLFQAVRFEPKGFRQRSPKPGGGWTWSVRGVRQIPYRLQDLLAADPSDWVLIPEGEKDADRAWSLGIPATTNSMGAGKWRPDHGKPLAGRRVAIIPDNDDAGRKHAQQVAGHLDGVAASVRIVELPGLPEKGDISDWLDAGGTAEQLRELIAATDERQPDPSQPQHAAGGRGGGRKQSQATTLVALTSESELYHDRDGDAYAAIPVDGHTEHHPVRSRAFKRRLARRYYIECGGAPSAQAMTDATTVIEGEGVFGGGRHDVHIRVGEHDDRIYIDLCDPAWRAVEITPNGWQVVENPPIRFRRAKAILPLPDPTAGGDVVGLRDLLNIADTDWPLIVAWLLAAMRPVGPYPILNLHGEQGSAKSTTARVLRSLVDPNASPLRSEPRNGQDLMIASNNGWVIGLDNLSHIPPWLSDALCRLSTGGGFSTRTLYENSEETIFDAQRPVILNGINEVATRGDLLDRSILVNLPTIVETKRKSEKDFWQSFDNIHAAMFGAMLTMVSSAMKNMAITTIDKLPRMADFAIWVTAGETAIGLAKGEFMAAYAANRDAGNELAIEASPMGKVLVDILADQAMWQGSASDLLGDLDQAADDRAKKLKTWPQTARTVSSTLKRLAPNLRASGFEVEFSHEGRGRRKRRLIT